MSLKRFSFGHINKADSRVSSFIVLYLEHPDKCMQKLMFFQRPYHPRKTPLELVKVKCMRLFF